MAGDPATPTSDPPAVTDHDLTLIAIAFGLGDIHTVTYLTDGLMNRNWRLNTRAGDYALKRLLDVSASAARNSARALAALHQRRLPVCLPALTTHGDPVCQIEERAYCLLPWVEGHHPTGADLTLGQARDLGTVVGRIHQVLNDPATDLPPPAPATPEHAEHPQRAITVARRYQQAAAAAGDRFDLDVVAALDRRIRLIERYAADRPADTVPAGPYGFTHGDLQPGNVLWSHGRIAAVIDWDRLRPRPFAEEIVRTATIQFGAPASLDLPRVAAFVGGYRALLPIHPADLADGVHRLWWKRLTDYWHLVYHYDRHNPSCDHLFLPGEALLLWWTDRYDQVMSAFTGPDPT